MALYSSTITNDGYIEHLYLNKGYTKEQVVSTLDLLELKAGEMYIVLYTRDLAIQITVSCYGEGQYTIDDNTNSVRLFSTLTDDTLNGWADYTTYEINDFALPMYDEAVVGNYNYKIVQAMGMSEFAEEILELEPYLFNLSHSVKKKKKLEGTLNAQALSSEIDTIAIGVETRDANARAYDLRVGRIAYAKNQKVVGNISDYFGEFEGEAIKSELTIPVVNNFSLSPTGKMTWDELDVSSLATYNPTVHYEITLNGFTITTAETSAQIYSYLKNGDNHISITGIITLESSKGETVQYEKTMEFIVTTFIIPDNRYSYGVASYGNNIYILGGSIGGVLQDDILVLDVVTEKWTTWEYKLPTPLRDIKAAATKDGIYVAMSYISSTRDKTTQYPIFMIKFDDGNIVAYDFKVGDEGQVTSDNNYLYVVPTTSIDSNIGDPRSPLVSRYTYQYGTIRKNSSINIDATLYGTAINVNNGILYAFGGIDSYNATKKIAKIDLNNESYEILSDVLPKAVTNAITCLVENNVYVLGGQKKYSSYGGGNETYQTVQQFNTLDDTCNMLDYTLSIPVYVDYLSNNQHCVVGRSCYLFNPNNSNLIYRFTV